jgi:hypothetical protein
LFVGALQRQTTYRADLAVRSLFDIPSPQRVVPETFGCYPSFMRRKRQTRQGAAAGQREAAADLGGQSGDMQGLSETAAADSESVAELAEEGQFFEAEAVSGVEDAQDADEAEVTTREVPQDDVPPEYRER